MNAHAAAAPDTRPCFGDKLAYWLGENRAGTRGVMMLSILISALVLLAEAVMAAPVPVELREPEPGRFELWREGAPYYVRGAGAIGQIERLAAAGANSVRTWDPVQTAAVIDEAQRLGLTVSAGLWIEHEHEGFNYDDDAAVQAQFERHRRTIERFKDHPALLLWGVGNEVELHATNPKVWDLVEAVAAYIKQVDPHHPVMTVTSHVPLEAIRELKQRCRSIDILGVNSYRGLTEVASAVRAAGWGGSYLITEWGCDGTWEVAKTPWDAEIEPTSTEKAIQRAHRYAAILANRSGCLGSYAFLWGQKQEGTPTWFGVFTEDGEETESVEMLAALWTGREPAGRAPRIGQLHLDQRPAAAGVCVSPGARVTAACAIVRGDELRTTWELLRERARKSVGGGAEERPAPCPLRDSHESLTTTEAGLEFSAPDEPGAYRLYVYVHAPGRQVATANFPFRVE